MVYFVFSLYYFFIMSSICLCVSVQNCIYQLSRLAVWAQPHPADHAWGLRWASSLVSSSAESSPRKHMLPAAAAIHQSDAQIRQTTNTHIRLAAKEACDNGITHGCLCLRHWVRGRGGRVRLLSQWILLLLRQYAKSVMYLHVQSRGAEFTILPHCTSHGSLVHSVGLPHPYRYRSVTWHPVVRDTPQRTYPSPQTRNAHFTLIVMFNCDVW